MSDLEQLPTSGIHVGDHVVDREDPSAPLLVVRRHVERAAAVEIRDGQTVADANPEYPADDRVVSVIYAQRHEIDVDGPRRYAFPQSRLERVEAIHDAGDDDGDDDGSDTDPRSPRGRGPLSDLSY